MKLTLTQNNESLALVLLTDHLSDDFKKKNQLTIENGNEISLLLNK